MFFSFDGVDGTGKTTQIERFCEWLREQGHEVVSCRDPGGTQLGEAVREILLQSKALSISRVSEMLLYMASRAQLVHEVIRPALDDGKTVVSDRFLLANIVYQGHAGGLDVESIRQVGQIATGRIEPNLTLLLDMDAKHAAARIKREPDRMEQQGPEYLARVREGFLAEASHPHGNIVVIDASRDVDQVQTDIRAAAQHVLKKRN